MVKVEEIVNDYEVVLLDTNVILNYAYPGKEQKRQVPKGENAKSFSFWRKVLEENGNIFVPEKIYEELFPEKKLKFTNKTVTKSYNKRKKDMLKNLNIFSMSEKELALYQELYEEIVPSDFNSFTTGSLRENTSLEDYDLLVSGLVKAVNDVPTAMISNDRNLCKRWTEIRKNGQKDAPLAFYQRLYENVFKEMDPFHQY
ncbi:MAG: hypothetical protein ACQEP1_05920 [Nanobdellota archaeon]